MWVSRKFQHANPSFHTADKSFIEELRKFNQRNCLSRKYKQLT